MQIPKDFFPSKVGLQAQELAFPDITVCNLPLSALAAGLSQAQKGRVEKLLSPMKAVPQMWDVWLDLVNGSAEARPAAFNVFENKFSNASVKALLQQIVLEAILAMAPPCSRTIKVEGSSLQHFD